MRFARAEVCCVGALWFTAACESTDSPAEESRMQGTGGAATGVDGGDLQHLDPHGTFETSRSMAFGEDNAVLESITDHDDYDYFKFDGTAGQWVAIVSETQSVIEVASTQLTLYDASQTQLAHNDYVQSIVGENVLSRLVVRLPADGTYYLLVQDPNAASASFGLVQPYRLILHDLAQTTERYAIANDMTADPATVVFKTWPVDDKFVEDAFLVGDFAGIDDVDVFAFDIVSDVVRLATFEIEIAGTEGNGSTTATGAVWLTDSSGATVLGRTEAISGQEILAPPVAPGRYLLSVAHPGDVLGNNDFFTVRALIRTENAAEVLDSTNGDLAGAEVLTLTENAGELDAFLLAHIGDQDVDYFRLDFVDKQLMSAHCASFLEGSGVVGLHVELRDAADAVLAEATESATERVALRDVAIPPGSPVYLRASKQSQSPSVNGDWMHCGIFGY